MGALRVLRAHAIRSIDPISQLSRHGRGRRCRACRRVWTQRPAAAVDQGQVRSRERVPPERQHTAEVAMRSFLGWALFAMAVSPAPSARADEITLIAPGGIREAIEKM